MLMLSSHLFLSRPNDRFFFSRDLSTKMCLLQLSVWLFEDILP